MFLLTEITLLRVISVDFNVTNQLLITYSAVVKYWRKIGRVQWDSTLDIYTQQESL
jgi:hypothetical protein